MADETVNLIELTADIVSAYVSNNPVPVASLPDLIASVISHCGRSDNRLNPKNRLKLPRLTRNDRCSLTTSSASRMGSSSNHSSATLTYTTDLRPRSTGPSGI